MSFWRQLLFALGRQPISSIEWEARARKAERDALSEAKRADKAEVALLALFVLCDAIDGHVPSEIDIVSDFEDPMPLPGMTAMIRNCLRVNGFERAP